MRRIYLLLISTTSTILVSAQDEQREIQQWQSLHPKTLFISADRWSTLSTKEQELLGTDVIVYQDNISMSLINEQTSLSKNTTNKEVKPTKDEDLITIKNWLSEHQDVKIISRSYFDALEEDRKDAYIENPYCLILEGETITLKDIESFGQ